MKKSDTSYRIAGGMLLIGLGAFYAIMLWRAWDTDGPAGLITAVLAIVMTFGAGAALSVSDENRNGSDPEGLRSEGLPARYHEVTDALTLSPKEQKGE